MPEDMARALGADGATTVIIADKQCTVRALGLGELTQVERICIRQYKRSYLQTYAENADLLENGQQILSEKMDQAAKWDIDDLPSKYAHDPKRIKLAKGLKKWLVSEFELNGETKDDQLQRLCATALDQEALSYQHYRKLTGERPMRVKVPYANWWITGSFDGMITFIWICFKHNGVTKEQVEEELGRNPLILSELAREIEELSVPAVENG